MINSNINIMKYIKIWQIKLIFFYVISATKIIVSIIFFKHSLAIYVIMINKRYVKKINNHFRDIVNTIIVIIVMQH